MTHIAVIDIGKTNAKLALVDLQTMSEVAVLTRPNTVLSGPPWPHFDVEGHWAFLLESLAQFHRAYGVAAITVTTHGACGALLEADGQLAAPILEYEFNGPDDLAIGYDAIRPDFAETGSPRLPMGLNLGAQLYWMFATDPGLRDRVATVLTYPQYWGFRLTGISASDVSSLGCHTDLWNPDARKFSLLVDRLGLAGKMAPARPASDVLGPILPEIAARTGLHPETPVYCGIHDSNASLLPHILGRAAPFSVVSTGTWVIAMAVGSRARSLDPARDTLINVSAIGDPVPSARFMGGREFEILISGQYAEPTEADVSHVLSEQIMLMPAIVTDSGPFSGWPARWSGPEPRLGTGARTVAASFYLAMMTATCLNLIGHTGPIVVEGPFARNTAYCQMLVAATGCPVTVANGATGTSHGAALLANPDLKHGLGKDEATFSSAPPPLHAYAKAWLQQAA
ncbi:FGGY-family carbohydrate kinase [Yoonia sediminilitoris]|uniref:Sugar (Pentulose or hexulose) kinase n=1 Tax=Yoonia sediminilitoris TaxID=1286148 RepID=A0A2T6KG33_9RHOB|nr:FGGY-family carbohydrate kinase [Yoonia sediminilitoris]PUB14295.1 sugar (pentulose or hexulose) kinase [Yoonia sediminilitoris]RCW95226.1 sugar (pentulose or hexulose) kinase [Yoonia sediminilitoris]